MIPAAAAVAADVYKSGVLAGALWRVGDEVTFRYVDGYGGSPVATSLPVGAPVTTRRFETPPFFAGLLPEGATRRRMLARSLHVAEDDELGLLAHVGADTIGDVQVLPAGEQPPGDEVRDRIGFSEVTFADLWQLPERIQDRSSLPGVQPKVSYQSRSLVDGRIGPVILKFSSDDAWRGVLENEALFLSSAARAGLDAARAEVVEDRDGVRAIAVSRFDRSVGGGRLVRHAQEDATQVLGIRPEQKYDPDAPR